MTVFLVNPLSLAGKDNIKYARFVPHFPPTGLAYIAAVLEKNGYRVIIEDQHASKISNENLLEHIRREEPQVVGFSCLTPAISNVKILTDQIRGFGKNIKIILGNLHSTLFAHQLLAEGIADIIVRGEGEVSMLEVVRAVDQKEGLGNIQGISFRDSQEIYHNPDRELVKDLDSLPYPAWHLFDLRQYINSPLVGVDKEAILPILASRGCTYRCTVCSSDKIFGRFRLRAIEKVIDEMEFLSAKFKVDNFSFCDAFFPSSIEYGLRFCDELIRRGLHKRIKWITETRVDKVNLDLLKKMKEAGLKMILYGFEVGAQKILDVLQKNTTLTQAKKAMEYTKKTGVLSIGQFMLGVPGETIKDCKMTIAFAKQLNPEIAFFNIVVPYPGSKFFEDYKNKLGNINYRTERFTSWPNFSACNGELIYTPQGINSRQLINLQKKSGVRILFSAQ